MRRSALIAAAAMAAAATILWALLGRPTSAHPQTVDFRANLESFQEVPSLSTTGTGTFRVKLVDDDTLHYELSYSGLEGGAVRFAHIHLGQPGVNGGVIAFLCGGDGKPDCPASGTVSGTITADNVVGPAGQGIAPGEFDEMVRAMRAGATYVNVHTQSYPGGEIRGQINAR